MFYVGIRKDFEPTFASNGVNVFSGHGYERAMSIEGVTYVVTSGGG